jgi:hypothetical protein
MDTTDLSVTGYNNAFGLLHTRIKYSIRFLLFFRKKECNDPTSKDENNIPSCYPCCSIQNCHCSPEKNMELGVSLDFFFPEEKIRVQNKKLALNFSGDCWQPPELI